MSSPSAILFDLGGTLLYPDYPFLKQQFAAKNHSLDVDTFLLAASTASNRTDVWMQTRDSTDATRMPTYLRFLLEELRLPGDVDDFLETVLLPRHRAVNVWTYLLDGTLDLLAELQSRYRLAIISNSDGRAEAKVHRYGMAPYVEFVMDSHLVGVEKPDPGIFLAACERLRLAPADCWYVGDIHSIDVVGANAAGLYPILIDRANTPRPDCQVIGSLFDLRSLLQVG